MATPGTAATATTRCSPSQSLQVSNDGASVAAPQPPADLEVLQPPPAACDTAASHAARRGLPRIVADNATSYPPPSLNSFRTAAARAPADSAPALWYWQLTGEEWRRDSHSYELAKKAWRRVPAEHKAAERERDRTRDRSGRKPSRKPPADDGARAAHKARTMAGGGVAWEPEDDDFIMEAVDREAPKWKLLVNELPGRTASSMRNRYQRIEKGRKLRDGDDLYIILKYRCHACGQLKRGHICPAKKRGGP